METNQNAESDKTPIADETSFPTEAETKEGDFVYRLFTGKDIYDDFADIVVIAELTYVGDEESSKISHGGSPFFFPLEDRTHGNKIDYEVTNLLIMRRLQKGVPFREKKTFLDDSEEYAEHVKTLMHEDFPEGDYIIPGSVQFSVEVPSGATAEQNFNMKADIGFTVTKGVNE